MLIRATHILHTYLFPIACVFTRQYHYKTSLQISSLFGLDSLYLLSVISVLILSLILPSSSPLNTSSDMPKPVKDRLETRLELRKPDSTSSWSSGTQSVGIPKKRASKISMESQCEMNRRVRGLAGEKMKNNTGTITTITRTGRSGLSTWKYQFSYNHWSQATLSLVSTWMGDCSSVAANP